MSMVTGGLELVRIVLNPWTFSPHSDHVSHLPAGRACAPRDGEIELPPDEVRHCITGFEVIEFYFHYLSLRHEEVLRFEECDMEKDNADVRQPK